MDIQFMFSEAKRMEASDLHFIVGSPPMLRVAGILMPIEAGQILREQDINELILTTLNAQQKEILETNKELDYSLATPSWRFRVNAYTQKNSLAAAFRLIPENIKSIQALGLPEICAEFVKLRQGLVLVTGPTGHGKSTSIASMINVINQTKPMHIVTIEDPIEYVYSPVLSIVSQRQMHTDTHSWNMALKSVLREDPDVVLIGEMRDLETIQAALTIVETGHLVFATLHTNSCAQTIDRIVDVFPHNQQSQIRIQFSNVLEGIISMRLVPALSGSRVPVAEILTGTPAIRTLIREGKTHLIDNVIQTSSEFGMISLESALVDRVKAGIISQYVGASYALKPEEYWRLIKSKI